jgi:hypothetical protein
MYVKPVPPAVHRSRTCQTRAMPVEAPHALVAVWATSALAIASYIKVSSAMAETANAWRARHARMSMFVGEASHGRLKTTNKVYCISSLSGGFLTGMCGDEPFVIGCETVHHARKLAAVARQVPLIVGSVDKPYIRFDCDNPRTPCTVVEIDCSEFYALPYRAGVSIAVAGESINRYGSNNSYIVVPCTLQSKVSRVL